MRDYPLTTIGVISLGLALAAWGVLLGKLLAMYVG